MFFDRLQEACNAQGIAMSALLDKVGMSRGNIARWKNGLEPKAATILKLAKELGVDRSVLEGREEEASNRLKEADLLDEADVAFYGRYKQLTEEEKEDMRDFLALMEARRERRRKGE